MIAMERAINDTHASVHQENVAEAHGTERNSKILALDHAMTTIKKCVNPEGTFKQHTGNKDPGFFAPRQKLAALGAIKVHCEDRVNILESEV
jgi:hypothetical protein